MDTKYQKKNHLIKTACNEKVYFQHNGLKLYRDQINLNDEDTFLLGPFDFVSIDDRNQKQDSNNSLECIGNTFSKIENPLSNRKDASYSAYYAQYHSIHENANE